MMVQRQLASMQQLLLTDQLTDLTGTTLEAAGLPTAAVDPPVVFAGVEPPRRLRRLRRSPQHAAVARQLDAADPGGHGLALAACVRRGRGDRRCGGRCWAVRAGIA